MVYALRLEHRLAKEEILALYLNLAPYGNQYAGARSRFPRVFRVSRKEPHAGPDRAPGGASPEAHDARSLPQSRRRSS